MESELESVGKAALIFGVPIVLLTVLTFLASIVYERSERKLIRKHKRKNVDKRATNEKKGRSYWVTQKKR